MNRSSTKWSARSCGVALVVSMLLASVAPGCGGDDDDASGTSGTSGTSGVAGSAGSSGGGGTAGSGGSSGSSGSAGASGSAGTGGTSGSSGSAGSSGTAGTGGTAGAGGTAGVSCDLGTEPTPLPEIAITFLQMSAQVMPPAPTGGDPTGLWRFDTGTIYLSTELNGVITADTSTATGTGFTELDGTNFRSHTHLDLTLQSPIAGTLIRTTDILSKGVYTVGATDITFAPECSIPEATSGTNPPRGFSVSGTRGTLITVSPVDQVPGATFTIVLEGDITPPN